MVLSIRANWLANSGSAGFLKDYFYSSFPHIAPKWTGLKTNGISSKPMKLRSRMFEDEYDLALAIIDGMEARSVKGGYTLERFKFNSTWLLIRC